jgi:hypothetical protein
MRASLDGALSSEIEKKNPLVLASPQRAAAMSRACSFLDALRDQRHCIDPANPADSQVLTCLSVTRGARPGSAVPMQRRGSPALSARSAGDVERSTRDIRALLDDESARLQTESAELRCALFATAEEIGDVGALEPPTTTAIEAFHKRLQARELVARNMAKAGGSSPVSKLRDSVRLNRLWG